MQAVSKGFEKFISFFVTPSGKDLEEFFQDTAEELQSLVTVIVTTIICLGKNSGDDSAIQISEMLNINLANFISDLFEVLSPTHSFRLV